MGGIRVRAESEAVVSPRKHVHTNTNASPRLGLPRVEVDATLQAKVGGSPFFTPAITS